LKKNYRIISLPARGGPNPYVSLFYDALSQHGIELIGRINFDIPWFKNNIDTFDAVHLHWPEALWRNYKGDLIKRLRSTNIPGSWKISNYVYNVIGERTDEQKFYWFKNCLEFLREKNKKIIWTWHNVEPHENSSDIDQLCNQFLADCADLIIFHSGFAESSCREIYKIKSKIIIMPHGNYDGVYPPPREREIVLKELGLLDGYPIVGCLGGIREYKGIDLACEAVTQLADKNLQFLCAGAPFPGFDLNGLLAKLEEINHSVCIPRQITDQEFSDYAHVCDFLLLPYRKVSGSGALLAYLTLGRGVVASDLPYFREVLSGSKNAGVLFKQNDVNSLEESIRKFLEVDQEERNINASILAEKYQWNDLVLPVAKYINKNFV